MEQVDDWLERLIEEKGDDLYRMKGVLSVTGSDQRYIFQVFPQLFMLYLLTSYTSRYFCRSKLDIFFFMFFSFKSSPPSMVLFFQGVHSLLDGCPGKAWGPDEKRINKLVFIGRNLDETALRKGFKGCLA
jgi:G3E family GTPase